MIATDPSRARLHVVLVEPQVAPNTGNIVRLCANTGAVLHLVEPLGFTLDDRSLRRAGLDYHELAELHVHPSWADLAATPALAATDTRRFAFTASATIRYDEVAYRPGDVLVFGTERDGLPRTILDDGGVEARAIPMRPGNRSLNLANAVAVVVYEAWRQLGFPGAGPPRGDDPGRIAETPAR